MDKANSLEGGYPPQQSSASYRGNYTPSGAPPKSKIANPGTLGLFSFANTTLILSLFNINTRGINTPNVVVGMAIFCGGLAQLLAGMWEFPRGNNLGATAFTSYGAFWLSYACILLPGTGIIDAYSTGAADELANALGIYLTAWTIVTGLFLIVSLRKSVAFIALFFCLTVTFALLAGANFNASVNATKAGGVVGVITAIIAFYIGLSEILAGEPVAVFNLPLGVFKRD
jgi:hypothetical protein